MSIRHILLPLTGGANSADAALCAMHLAKRLNGHVSAGYESMMEPWYFASAIDGDAYTTFYEDVRKIRKDQQVAAKASFDRAVAAVNVRVGARADIGGSASWVDCDDNVSLISSCDVLTDLVVLDIPDGSGSRLGSNFIERTLFRMRRPALIVGTKICKIDGTHALVAWNGSQEAARAVRHALDLLEPGAKVTVVQVGEQKPRRLSAQRLLDYIGWHGFMGDLRTIPAGDKPVPEVLLDELHRSDAGCLVMGAYTHRRTWEQLFGGVTDFMLRNAPVPVFMAH